MLNTVFKDKVSKGTSYPFPLEFLRDAIPDMAEQLVALYFVHSSLWVFGRHNASKETLRLPRLLLAAGKARPFLRNNNQKVTEGVDYDWHFLLRGMPSESRNLLQRGFTDRVAQPFGRWLEDRSHRSSCAHIWWHAETKSMELQFR